MMDLQFKPSKQPAKKSHLPTIIIIGICVVLNVFVLVYLFLPQLTNVATKRIVLNMKISEFKGAEQQFTTTEQVTAEQKEALLSELPAASLGSKELTTIYELAKDSKLEFVSFLKKEPETGQTNQTKDPNIQTDSFDVKVVGHLDHMLFYLNNLQNHKPIIGAPTWKLTWLEPDNVASTYPFLFNNPNMDKTKPVYELSITFELYTMPQLAEAFQLEKPSKVGDTDAMSKLRAKYPSLKLSEAR
ncbi:hypothetical protein [Bacillus sp. FJAT-26390]|uniref:hypothetical protein n=1 Tax=Bacillus sp. FJAT-26390 TaxID=1743142 RepID=UPI001146CD11|nr:hypothetical protein [Bacillus sp. FJAT-26390]